MSFSFFISFAYSADASSALDTFFAVSSATWVSPLAALFPPSLGAEHATRLNASTGTINSPAIFDSLMFSSVISKLIGTYLFSQACAVCADLPPVTPNP